MKINVTGQQYRELTYMMALNSMADSILGYWNNEMTELKNNKVKLSKATGNIIQRFVLSLSNTMLEQKQKYIEIITELGKTNGYEVDENTTVQLADGELAIILQQTADTKETDKNGLE